ncbi:MAG: T9SS type A sorting domain-containing protein [Lewinella sp.]|uniref:T9SS type A sorting domain-containing protein n=1 Tax=Lewinella sp. TaxID=2004506 RepID=UPI003D6BAB2C
MKNLFLVTGLILLFNAKLFCQQDGVIDDPGDLAFVGYSGIDASDDGFSFVLFDDVPINAQVFFTDEEYNSSNSNFGTGEGDVTWTNNTGAVINKGTVVNITDPSDNDLGISADIGTAAETDSGFGIGPTEVLYAFIGTRNSPTVISMIRVGNNTGGIPANLTVGTTAILILNPDLDDTFLYMGPENCNGTLEECQMEIYDLANWIDNDGSGFPNSGFGPFTGSTFGAPLPVEFTSFTAQTDRAGVLLKWQTAKEENNDYFQIEHSIDGRNFSTLGKVEGNGTTNNFSNYTFLDEKPAAGINYYRLKQVDYDGAFEYSDIASAQFGDGSATVVVYPNPFSDQLTLSLPTGSDINDRASNPVLKITNLHGQVVRQEVIVSTPNYSLNLGDLVAGTYILQVYQDGLVRTTQRLVKF